MADPLVVLPKALYRDLAVGQSFMLPVPGGQVRIELIHKSGRRARLKIETYSSPMSDKASPLRVAQ